MKKLYFKRKVVLDIGCNAGYLTISLAERFKPKMILGIDIDGILISKAQKVLSSRAHELRSCVQILLFIERQQKPVLKNLQDEFSEGLEGHASQELMSFQNYHFKEPSIYEDEDVHREISDSLFRSFPYNVYFRKEDFMNDEHFGKSYDTITCFSVSKWVHLNWGDDGLLLLLLKSYALLKPFGIFIIEYQSWSSYHKKRFYSPSIREHYPTIKIHPESIPILLQRLGMQLLSNRKPNSMDSLPRPLTKGLNRNIAVFKKVGPELEEDVRHLTPLTLRDHFDVSLLIQGLEKENVK